LVPHWRLFFVCLQNVSRNEENSGCSDHFKVNVMLQRIRPSKQTKITGKTNSFLQNDSKIDEI
jgi:hypothetical protein